MLKMIRIRLMDLSDVSQVSEIEKQIFTTPWSEASFKDTIARTDTIYLVACENEEIAGYCGLRQCLEEADITNVAVKQCYRGRHIARNMLTKLIELGVSKGIEAFTLEVRESNENAIKLYLGLGFEPAGIRKNFYQKPVENAVIMWKR